MMPLLFSLDQPHAVTEVQNQLKPGELLFVFLDDIHVVCRPERVGVVHTSLETAFWGDARVHAGKKTRVESRGRQTSSLRLPRTVSTPCGGRGASVHCATARANCFIRVVPPVKPRTFGFGLLCETPAVWGRRGFTRQPENSKRAHLRVPAFQTPPKFHEKTPREKKSENGSGRGEKKPKILGLPRLRPPTLRGPTLGAPPCTHTDPNGLAKNGLAQVPSRWFPRHCGIHTEFSISAWDATVKMARTHSPIWPTCWLQCTDRSLRSSFEAVQNIWDAYIQEIQLSSNGSQGALTCAMRY